MAGNKNSTSGLLFSTGKKQINSLINDSDALMSKIIVLDRMEDAAVKETLRNLAKETTIQMSHVTDDLDGINNYAREVRSLSRADRTITTVKTCHQLMSGDEVIAHYEIQCTLKSSATNETVEEDFGRVPIKVKDMPEFLRFKEDESDGEDVDDTVDNNTNQDQNPRTTKPVAKFQPPFSRNPVNPNQVKQEPPPRQERTNSITSYPQFEKFRNKEKRRSYDDDLPIIPGRKQQQFRNKKLQRFVQSYDDDSEDSNPMPQVPSFQTATQVAGHIFNNKNGRNLGCGKPQGSFGGFNGGYNSGNGFNGNGTNGSNGNGYSLGQNSSSSGFIPPTKMGGPQKQSSAIVTEYAYIFEDERVKNMEKTLIEKILSEIVQKKDMVTFDAIAGLKSVKTRIRELVILPMVRPELFQGIRSPGKGVLLFGPPGTGKSMIGKCVASQSKATFFSISASVLTSKWVGDGEKMVRALFTVARILQPTVIFIDEIDSLLMQRNDQDHECSRRMKTEFLLQFDGMSGEEDDRLLVIGATNRPEGLDEAARRRFTSRLYIPLPSKEARIQIVTTILKRNETVNHNLTEEDLDKIGEKTDGYSGADMSSLAKEAAMLPLRSAMSTNSILHINPEDLRPIDVNDFLKSLDTVKSSVSPSEIEHYEKFNQTFGA